MLAVSDINLDIKEGEFVSIVGPSGCGKSTLMMIISGLIPPSSGSVHIGDVRVDRPFTDLGIVFQRDVLLDWRSVLGNVMLQADVRKLERATAIERAFRLLEMVGLEKAEAKRPYELSGGMRQRVAICRALLHDPPLLLMDEPFGALDALTRDQLNSDIAGLSETLGKTVVFVTHSISEAVFLSDRVVVMSASPGAVRDIVDIQLERPRTLSVRDSSTFADHMKEIRTIFIESGILH